MPRGVIETEELKPEARTACARHRNFDRWRNRRPHCSTPSSPKSSSTRAATPRCGRRTVRRRQGRLDNLKELVRSMGEFETLQAFLEHIALVIDRDGGAPRTRSGDGLHSAKGLEFHTVFLPGWEEGLFPSQRTLDDQGRAGLGGRAPPCPCRPDPRTPSRKNLFRHQPPHSRHLVDHNPLALPRRPARRECRGRGVEGRPAAGAAPAAMVPRASTISKRSRSSYGTPDRQRPQANKARGQKRGGFEEDNNTRYRSQTTAAIATATRRRAAAAMQASAASQQQDPAHDRGRAGRQEHRHTVRFFERRPRVSPEIRLRPGQPGRRQQAGHPIRQGRRKACGGSRLWKGRERCGPTR